MAYKVLEIEWNLEHKLKLEGTLKNSSTECIIKNLSYFY